MRVGEGTFFYRTQTILRLLNFDCCPEKTDEFYFTEMISQYTFSPKPFPEEINIDTIEVIAIQSKKWREG